jgi:hypothetical protein
MMGELADSRLQGDDCECCGLPFSTPGEGFPRTCDCCWADDAPSKPAKRVKSVQCPVCTRTFQNLYALAQHRSAKEH